MQKRGLIASFLSAALATAVALTSFFGFPRDVVVTRNIATFDSSTIVGEKLWNETPVQLLYTFMGGGSLLNPGMPGEGGFEFGTRLRLAYGNEKIGFVNQIIDLRDSVTKDLLDTFISILRTTGYESMTPCPHDYNLACEVIFTWNRDRTKEVGIQMVFIRLGEMEYGVVDDSLLGTE